VFGARPPRALVILDSGPETGWRLSSPPLTVDLGPDLPVFMARTVDWSQDWSSSRVSVVRGEPGSVEVSGLTTCSDNREVFVGEELETESGCVQRKWLHENGSITERKCVRKTCMRDGLPCYPPILKYEHHECKQIIHLPLFSSLHQKENVLSPQTFSFISNQTTEICCKSSSEYMNLYGIGCSQLHADILSHPKCLFSKAFSLYPCCNKNCQENTKFCLLPDIVCIVQVSFATSCGKTEPWNTCDKDISCKNVIGLKTKE
jgi:hypothetical protein